MGLEEETPLGAGQDQKALVGFHLEIQCFTFKVWFKYVYNIFISLAKWPSVQPNKIVFL